MLGLYVRLLCCCYIGLNFVSGAEEIPNWRNILANFHNKVGEIFDENRADSGGINALAGKVFRYDLPGHNGLEYEVRSCYFISNTITLNKLD